MSRPFREFLTIGDPNAHAGQGSVAYEVGTFDEWLLDRIVIVGNAWSGGAFMSVYVSDVEVSDSFADVVDILQPNNPSGQIVSVYEKRSPIYIPREYWIRFAYGGLVATTGINPVFINLFGRTVDSDTPAKGGT